LAPTPHARVRTPSPDLLRIVWCQPAPGDAPIYEEWYRHLITSEERERCNRFLREQDRRSHLLARWLVRRTLSEFHSVPMESLEFVANRFGKPFVSLPRTARGSGFNLSHTEGVVACATCASRHVGIDVERVRAKGSPMEVARHAFAKREVTYLESLEATVQREEFYKLWTLKEAYIKARGRGLSIPLSSVAFELGEHALTSVRFAPELGDDPNRWQFFLPAHGNPGWQMAAAVRLDRSRRVRLTCAQTRPFASNS